MSQLLEYKCPACGGAMEFDSSLQKMKCPYCDTVLEVEDLSKFDDILDNSENVWDMSDNQWQDGETEHMNVFVCNSCGGEIVGDENTSASECPFCGNQVVISGRFKGDLKPNYVIPFKLDKKAAKAKYEEFIKDKYLLPKLFKSENHIDEIKGIYVPFWLYDSDISAFATFEASNVRTWRDSKYDYREVSNYLVYRAGDMSFEHIPCDGSSKMDDDLMESIEPFDFADAVPFQSAYLAGYFADKYDVDVKDNEIRANTRILDSAVSVLRDTFEHQYDTISTPPLNLNAEKWEGNAPFSSMKVIDGEVKYALYPVWLLTSTYKGKKYTFAMNGQTGKFVGNLPIDKKKSALTFAGVFAAVSTVATLLLNLFMG